MCNILLKPSFLLPDLFCNVDFEFSWFHNTNQSSEILILKNEMLLEFQNKKNNKIIKFWLMHFGFVLDSSDIDLWNIDLIDTHISIQIDTDISNKHFVCLQDILKASSRHVFKMSERRLQHNHFVFKPSWKTKYCYAEDVLKSSSRHNLKSFSRRVLKTFSRRLEVRQMFVGLFYES